MALTADGIPKQVQEQADLAEEFMATLYGKKEEEEDTDKDKEGEEGSEADASDAGEQDGSAEGDEGDPNLETADQGTQDDEDDGEEDTYRKRYETLQGKYNAEVPKLNSELRKLKEDIFARLGDLSKATEQPTADDDADDTAQYEAELEAYREQFGDDLLKVIDKISERRAKTLLGESLSPVSQKVDSVESAQIQSAQTAFADDLSSKVEGDWEPLWKGEDEGFMAFLDTKEPNGFFTYREVAKKANDTWDADTLSKVFNTYLASQKPPEKVKQDKGKEKVADKVNQDRVAPSRKKVADEPSDGEARIWTQADIKEFQEKDRKGKYSEEESQALWEDFLRAPSEGRIVA